MVRAADGSIAALLGASPGASTAVSIMVDLIRQCFPDEMNTEKWQQKLIAMIPSYGKRLGEDEVLLHEIRNYTSRVLELETPVEGHS